jgi:hypothetical protein
MPGYRERVSPTYRCGEALAKKKDPLNPFI